MGKHIGDIVVVLGVAAIAAWALIKLFKNKKEGKACSFCPSENDCKKCGGRRYADIHDKNRKANKNNLG